MFFPHPTQFPEVARRKFLRQKKNTQMIIILQKYTSWVPAVHV